MTLDDKLAVALEPCPWCGPTELTINEHYDTGKTLFYIQCDTCWVEGSYKLSKAEAIAAWNRRPAVSALMERQSLFVRQDFISHSGQKLHWKIECDALTDAEIETLAFMIAERRGFGRVIGVPSGGLRLAKALEKYSTPQGTTLIVDDVLTTGASMEAERAKLTKPSQGFVIFARGPYPYWVTTLQDLLVGPPGLMERELNVAPTSEGDAAIQPPVSLGCPAGTLEHPSRTDTATDAAQGVGIGGITKDRPALIAVLRDAVQLGAIEFPYDETFNAIADAVTWREYRTLGISVAKFQKTLRAYLAKSDNSPSDSRSELTAPLQAALVAFAALPPEEQEAHRQAQRESWGRGEMAMQEPPTVTHAISAETQDELKQLDDYAGLSRHRAMDILVGTAAPPPSDPAEDRRVVIEAFYEWMPDRRKVRMDIVALAWAKDILSRIEALPAPARAALARLLREGL